LSGSVWSKPIATAVTSFMALYKNTSVSP